LREGKGVKKLFEIALIIIILLLLSGCGIKEGCVYEKKYTPAHSQTTIILAGKVLVPTTTYYEESYTLRIRKYNPAKRKWFYGNWNVSKEDYQQVNIGDYLRFD
jgi:hypothetical protein